jgi:hypothetical protein
MRRRKIKDAMNKDRNVREGEDERGGNQREPSLEERSLTRGLRLGRGAGKDFDIIS